MTRDIIPEEDIFFDVHCHTMNLSHPCLFAFLKRFLKVPHNPVLTSVKGATLGSITGLLAPFLGKPFLNKYLNHLSIMERDVARIHMAMEDDLPKSLKVGSKEFKRVSVSPLLMDFWADETAKGIHYQFTPKSIIPQVLDVLNGIADYANIVRGDHYEECIKQFQHVKDEGRQIGLDKQWHLDLRKLDSTKANEPLQHFGPNKRRIISFPFMGLNTEYCFLDGVKRQSHESTNLNTLLEKYFGNNEAGPFTGTFSGLSSKFGQFTGNLDDARGDYFAGIKVYPPLGFDPWPEGNDHELKKVEHLYDFCERRKVPITSHCSDGGFKVGEPKIAAARSHPKKWAEVLKHYRKLKLNIAHFGGENSGLRYKESWWSKPFLKLFHGGDPEWVMTIITLLKSYENVYTDMSYSGVSDKYYKVFGKIVNDHGEIKDKLLFGSDFTINLLSIDSYQHYLKKFTDTETLDEALKLKMCNTNPRKFLFQ
ncbi:amidohydrolase [bacterium]|nr:amidohydrolase [bacterium]